MWLESAFISSRNKSMEDDATRKLIILELHWTIRRKSSRHNVWHTIKCFSLSNQDILRIL